MKKSRIPLVNNIDRNFRFISLILRIFRSNKTVVTPDDLWDAMNEQVIKDRLKLPKTIKDIMEPWTLNAGYPLITVEIENEDVIIKQVNSL